MRVGLIGYGKMGRGISSLLSEAGLEMTVLVRDPDKASDHNAKQEKRLRRAAKSGLFLEGELPQRLAASRFSSNWNDLADCSLLIETVVEDWDTKVDLLLRLEQLVDPRAVITTNSSSFSPTRLAAHLSRPQQFCGYHFFHPTQLTNIVEIVVGQETAPETVELLCSVTRDIARTPLVFKDYAGSSINVILTGLTCETLYALEEGLVRPSDIDAIAGQFARVGTCESLDVIGIPFFTEVLERTLAAFPFKYKVPELLYKLIRDGRYGKYAGQGLYLYRDDRPCDDAKEYYINPESQAAARGLPSDAASLNDRMLFQLYYCTLYLAQMGLGDLRDFCLGIQDLIGLKACPWTTMRTLGADRLREKFRQLEKLYGPRYDCAPLEGAIARLNDPQ